MSGDTILRTFGFDPDGLQPDLIGLAVMLIVAWGVTLLLLGLHVWRGR